MVVGKSSDNVEIKFRRDLSLLDVTMISAGAMTGASIYVLAGPATLLAGPAILIVMLISVFFTIFTAMAYAELSSAFPEAGGGYLWIKKALPRPFGFMSGWISWFGHSIACSFYTVVFAEGIVWLIQAYGFNVPFLTNIYLHKFIIILVLIAFIIINYWGTNTTGKTQTVLTLIQFSLISIFIVAGFVAVYKNPHLVQSFTPFFPHSTGILVAMGLMFIAYEGYEIVAQSAEEIRDPDKNLPKSIFLSIIITTILYVLIFFVSIGATSWHFVANRGTFAVIDVSGLILPVLGKGVILVALLVGSVATLNATIFSASRVSFAMGRDHVFPSFFGKLHHQHKTPHVAVIISGIMIGIIAVFLPILDIVAAADIMFLLLFILVNMAALILRYKMPELHRTYKIPFFPILPIIGMFALSILAIILYTFSATAWYLAIGWTEVGLIIYYFSKGKKEIETYVPEYKMPAKPVFTIPEKKHIVVAALKESEQLVALGTWLAKEQNYELTVFSVIEVPLTTLKNKIAFAEYAEYIKSIEKLAKFPKKADVKTRVIATVSSIPSAAILDEATAENAEMLLIEWRKLFAIRLFSSTIEMVYKKSKHNLIVFKNTHMKQYLAHLTVLVNHSLDDELALAVTCAIAKNNGSKVQILSITEPGETFDLTRYKDMCIEKNIEAEILQTHTYQPYAELIKICKTTDMLIMTHTDFEQYFYNVSRFFRERALRMLRVPLIITKKATKTMDFEKIAMMHKH